jgi:hypothetical protein
VGIFLPVRRLCDLRRAGRRRRSPAAPGPGLDGCSYARHWRGGGGSTDRLERHPARCRAHHGRRTPAPCPHRIAPETVPKNNLSPVLLRRIWDTNNARRPQAGAIELPQPIRCFSARRAYRRQRVGDPVLAQIVHPGKRLLQGPRHDWTGPRAFSRPMPGPPRTDTRVVAGWDVGGKPGASRIHPGDALRSGRRSRGPSDRDRAAHPTGGDPVVIASAHGSSGVASWRWSRCIALPAGGWAASSA